MKPKLILVVLFTIIGFLITLINESVRTQEALANETGNAGWGELSYGSATGDGISTGVGEVILPSTAITSDGDLIVAWGYDAYSDGTPNPEIYVKRWNGSAWIEIGNGSASGGGISNSGGYDSTFPDIALDSEDNPIVAWADTRTGGWDIYVKRWNGSDWIEIGNSASGDGISNTVRDSTNPSIVVDSSGNPIVAWTEHATGGTWTFYIRRWDGSAWVEMDSSATGNGISNNSRDSLFPSLAITPDGTPIVAWVDGDVGNSNIYVRRWNGSKWVEMDNSASGGGISNSSSGSYGASLAVTPSGAPIIAWLEGAANEYDIYVRRWNGSHWVEMDNSASDGGISDNSGASSQPSLAIGPDGASIIAWQDDNSGNEEIYVRRWAGNNWNEIDSGSASSNGISNTAGDSLFPSLSVGPDNIPIVAWKDGANGLHVRQYEGDVIPPVPSPPTNVQASDGTQTVWVRVTWDSVSEATEYEVYRSTTPSGNKTKIGSQSSTTFYDYTSRPFATYYYWVKACNASGCSNYSDYDTGYRHVPPPDEPSGVQASDGSYTDKVRVKWNTVSGATEYEVYRATSSGGNKTKLGSPTGTYFYDTSASVETTYYYWVKACNSYGCSNYSNYNTGYRSGTFDISVSGLKIYPEEPRAADQLVTVTFWLRNSGTLPYNIDRDGLRITIKMLEGTDYQASLSKNFTDIGVKELDPGQSHVVATTFYFLSPTYDGIEIVAGTEVDEEDVTNNSDQLKDIHVKPSEYSLNACTATVANSVIAYAATHLPGSEHAALLYATVGSRTMIWVTEVRELLNNEEDEAAIDATREWVLSIGTTLISYKIAPKKILIDLVVLFLEASLDAWECGTAYANFYIKVNVELIQWITELGENLNMVVVRSPINVRIENAAGQTVGFNPDGSIVNEIDGAEVKRLSSGAKLIVYPGKSTETIEIFGYDEGTFTLDVAITNRDGTIDSIGYKDVPVTPTSLGIVDLVNNQHLLALDDDGDGDVDRRVEPEYVEEMNSQARAFLPVISHNSDGTPSVGAYELHTLSVGQGTIDVSPDKPSYNIGRVVNLRAIPASGWKFAGWVGELSEYGNPAEFEIKGQHRAIAIFEEIETSTLAWEEIGPGSASGGGISNNSLDSTFPSLAVAPDGSPIVAWSDESSGNSEIYVRRWNGSAWAKIGPNSASGGGISSDSTASSTPSLVVTGSGKPIIAWADGNGEIYIKHWNGTDWTEMGTNSASDGGISNTGHASFPSLAVAPDGIPLVAWVNSPADGSSNIYVRRWNGNSWVEIGHSSASGNGISNTDSNSTTPSLAVTPDGTPVVAWTESDKNIHFAIGIYVRRWNGSTWEEIGEGSASGRGISDNLKSSPSLALLSNGFPIIASQYHRLRSKSFIFVSRWNGSDWIEMGESSYGVSYTNGESTRPSLAVAPDDMPFIAWTEDMAEDVEIYVRRWNGSKWVQAGGSSATGGGISSNDGHSLLPSIAVNSSGHPMIAWWDYSEGDGEIYIKRWTGD